MNASIKNAVFSVFNDADNSSASFAERLFAFQIFDRAAARPLAMEWAAKKYGAKIEQGQRGDKLPRDSAAEKAMNRVLAVCFPSVDVASAKAAGRNQADPIEKMLAAYAKLSAGQKRSFKAALLKL